MWKGATIACRADRGDADLPHDINRVAKYGLLFVLLSFATYFFFEALVAAADPCRAVRPARPFALGRSRCCCSRSPNRSATPRAIWSAPALVLAQSTLYTAAVARRFKPAFVFALMLTSLFGFIYVLLGLETYSLLTGALALFVVVSALMVLTQMVRWPGRPETAEAA